MFERRIRMNAKQRRKARRAQVDQVVRWKDEDGEGFFSRIGVRVKRPKKR